jgi:hypothetical protein
MLSREVAIPVLRTGARQATFCHLCVTGSGVSVIGECKNLGFEVGAYAKPL